MTGVATGLASCSPAAMVPPGPPMMPTARPLKNDSNYEVKLPTAEQSKHPGALSLAWVASGRRLLKVRRFVQTISTLLLALLPVEAQAQVGGGRCPQGQAVSSDTAGRCCWPEQVWSASRQSCFGRPLCPAGFNLQSDTCVAISPPTPSPPVAACAPGQGITQDTAGHCCWPAQVWSSSRQSCFGTPQCSDGYVAQGDSCAPRTPPSALPPTSTCPAGQLTTPDTAGQCCWPAQVWSASRQSCFGTPQCPAGFITQESTCVMPTNAFPADTPRPTTSNRGASAGHRFEGIAYVGVGSLTNTSSPFVESDGDSGESRIGPSVGFHLLAGYRILPAVSVGARLGYQLFSNGDSDADVSQTALLIGAYARLHLSSQSPQSFKTWVGAGLDVVGTFSATRNSSSSGGSSSGSISTFGLPLSAGFEYTLSPSFDFSGMATFSPMFPREACGGSFCTDSGLETNFYFFLGLGIRYNLFF